MAMEKMCASGLIRPVNNLMDADEDILDGRREIPESMTHLFHRGDR